ncbi:NAD(P)/FAD-dependent oxidoreductase [Chitinophaga ginsengisoli]|uniref:NADH:ubiquinone reductase (non-electrogenic) n=1 Tax=Chitinophaga ginsengisoli TaxID=363837 RepID=A0A2P8GL45_9BACT|nr:NAD(P)/FAD-dependent oxidoreductase [Chitinophaga ginsengisoli]PSL34688.1 NADH dehydrogenase [Chitinophaga ginsengisoli]
MTTNGTDKKIIIVGGGFAGLNFIQQLYRNDYYDVTLVDRNNYNYFTPLLYQVATSFLEPSSISYPFRKLFRDKKINFRMGGVTKVDPAAQRLYLDDDSILSYDHLVFAAGAQTNFFGLENIKRNAISLKGVNDALIMRNTLLKTMEEAAATTDPAERTRLLTIVVAGGGPTGVEVAGMLAEMRKYIMTRDYPELAHADGDIYIVNGEHNLLQPMSEKTHKGTYKALDKLGVRIKLHTKVTDYADQKVTFSDGEVIEAGTLIWTAGVTANTFEGMPATSLGPGGRMKTDHFNKVEGVDNIYAIGDISIQTTDPAYPKGHPQVAQVAIQQGRTLAKNFLSYAKGKKSKPFKYFDRGEMAIVGRHNAVVDLFKHRVHVNGFPALIVWLFIHVASLVNYNNKIRTMYSWIVAYITRDQFLRMIFRT